MAGSEWHAGVDFVAYAVPCVVRRIARYVALAYVVYCAPVPAVIDRSCGAHGRYGFLTINSQPAVDAAPSHDPNVGWVD